MKSETGQPKYEASELFMFLCIFSVHYQSCPHSGATTLLDLAKPWEEAGGGGWSAHAQSSTTFCVGVMVVAVIMLSFILSRTLCQTVAEASYKSYPSLVTTLRAFTTSSPKCGEDSSGGKIILINVNVQVKSKVHVNGRSPSKLFLAVNPKRIVSQKMLVLMII